MAAANSDPTAAYLPFDLIESIVSLLPIADVARFRCTSRLWNCVISSSAFTRKRCKVKGGEDIWFVVDYSIDGIIASLDVPMLRWHLFKSPNAGYRPIAADAGLVLLVHEDSPIRFSVWNPITGKVRHLPLTNVLTAFPVRICGFAVDDAHGNTYKILVTTSTRHDFNRVTSKLFDSKRSLWTTGPEQSNRRFGFYHNNTCAVFCSGRFYVPTYAKCYVFDEQNMVWSRRAFSSDRWEEDTVLRNSLMNDGGKLVHFTWDVQVLMDVTRSPLEMFTYVVDGSRSKDNIVLRESVPVEDLGRLIDPGPSCYSKAHRSWYVPDCFSAWKKHVWIRLESRRGTVEDFVYDISRHTLRVCPPCPVFELKTCFGFAPNFSQAP